MGKRVVPSAGALYPLPLVAAGDQREKLVNAAWGQEWTATAPAVIRIAAALKRTTAKYGNRAAKSI